MDCKNVEVGFKKKNYTSGNLYHYLPGFFFDVSLAPPLEGLVLVFFAFAVVVALSPTAELLLSPLIKTSGLPGMPLQVPSFAVK